MEKNVIDESIMNSIYATKTSFAYVEGQISKMTLFNKELVIRVKCHDKPETYVIFNSVEITDDKTVFLSSGKVYGEEFENRDLEYIW